MDRILIGRYPLERNRLAFPYGAALKSKGLLDSWSLRLLVFLYRAVKG